MSVEPTPRIIGLDLAHGQDTECWVQARCNPDGTFTIERALTVIRNPDTRKTPGCSGA